MTVFQLLAAIVLKEITSDQAVQWYFGNLFVPFGLLKMIVVNADGFFAWIFRENFQETLLILLYVVAIGNHKAIIN